MITPHVASEPAARVLLASTTKTYYVLRPNEHTYGIGTCNACAEGKYNQGFTMSSDPMSTLHMALEPAPSVLGKYNQCLL